MSTAVRFEVRRARTPQEVTEALKLRYAVFCVEQGVPEREEVDGRDHEGLHLVAVAVDDDAEDGRGELLGTCRLVLHAQTYARPLYDQAGYMPRGSVFREAGIEHIAMEKELA